MIEFANILSQYSPWTYASTHVGFIWFVSLCPNGSCLKLEIGEIFHIFPSGTESMGDRGSKKAYTPARTGMYLHTKFGCDRSIVVGCRSRNDWQTYIQTHKHPGMTIMLTLCETWCNISVDSCCIPEGDQSGGIVKYPGIFVNLCCTLLLWYIIHIYRHINLLVLSVPSVHYKCQYICHKMFTVIQ